LVNCGAPVPSTHCAKKAVNCCWLCASATFSKSPRADGAVGVLAERALERGQEGLVADLPRSMWKIMAPFSRVMDWNSGEKGLRRPALDRGMVS
jgi:hypothetical protein